MNSSSPGRREQLRKPLTLVAVCLSVLVLPASLTGTSVALPDIGSSLHAGLVSLQWIINAYNLTFACFMLAFAGLLVNSFGWRGVFVDYLVVDALVLAVCPFLGESKDPDAKGVDWAGTTTFSLGLFLLTLAMVEGPQWGWGSRAVIGLFLGFVALLILLPSYLAAVLGDSPGRAGLTLLLLSGPVFIVPLLADRLVKLTGSRVVLCRSLLVITLGVAWLTVLHPGIGLPALAGPLLLIGVGMGLSAGLIDGLAISSVTPERAGMAGGMFNTMRLAGETVAIAAMGPS